jgi:flagellar biosynthesis protein FlhB
MSEQDNSQDRNLPASEQKLRKAREKGQVARSRDLGSAFSFTVALLVLFGMGSQLLDACIALVRRALTFNISLFSSTRQRTTNGELSNQVHATQLFEWTVELGTLALSACLPVIGLCALGAIIGHIALGGIAWTSHPLAPDPNRINPFKGIARLFSKHHFLESSKLLFVVFCLVILAGFYVFLRADELLGITQLDHPTALRYSVEWLRSGALLMLLVLVTAAFLDAPLQWIKHSNELKMTFQEAKQESKESEGDPHVKSRMKRRQRELSQSRMMAAVPKASVIVTNPTHFAVALRYDEDASGAPRVVAKGADLLAAKIKEAAALAGVPTLEAPPLARALYAHAKVGMEVPPALYTAVAQVLAYVYQLKAHMAGERKDTLPQLVPGSLEVPAELDPGVDPSGTPADSELIEEESPS